jgi:uncharacterized protein YcbX
MSQRATVVSVRRYPVKACAGESPAVADVREDGLRNDRVLAVVSGDRIVTQRELPRLARVRPALDDETGRLTLSYDGRDPVEEVVDVTGRPRIVSLFGAPVEVVDQAPTFSAWLTDLLGRPARLVGAPTGTRRTSTGAVPGKTALSDAGCVSLHSEASLDLLNRELGGRGHAPLPADRFRANVVIGGCAAHAEDETAWFECGELRMGFAELDERCAVTAVDQQAGERAGPEPLRTLTAYRRLASGGVAFGVYAAVVRPGTLRVGDPVDLVARS